MKVVPIRRFLCMPKIFYKKNKKTERVSTKNVFYKKHFLFFFKFSTKKTFFIKIVKKFNKKNFNKKKNHKKKIQ